MTFYSYVTKNKLIINNLFKNGVISSTLIVDYEIYTYYVDLINTKRSKRDAILLCMHKFNISKKKMYLLLNRFEEEVV